MSIQGYQGAVYNSFKPKPLRGAASFRRSVRHTGNMFMKSVNSRATRVAIPAKISSTGLVIEGTSSPQLLLGFLDSVLRGIGQVMLQSNSYTGLLFLIGIFYNSMLFGWAVLLGTTASTATAVLLEVDRSRADGSENRRHRSHV